MFETYTPPAHDPPALTCETMTVAQHEALVLALVDTHKAAMDWCWANLLPRDELNECVRLYQRIRRAMEAACLANHSITKTQCAVLLRASVIDSVGILAAVLGGIEARNPTCTTWAQLRDAIIAAHPVVEVEA